MWARICGSSRRPTIRRCDDLRGRYRDYAPITARQQGILGFSQGLYSAASVILVGAGGLNGEVAEGLVRKGIGALDIFDGDSVEPSNLNRQLFNASDIGKNKADRLARNLCQQGFLGTIVRAHPGYFQERVESGPNPAGDVIVCGVDNDDTRVFLARFGQQHSLPVIFVAVSRDANQGYVFIQQPSRACFVCRFPAVLETGNSPCPNTPAIKDILKVVAGLVLYAIDSVVCSRPCNWNYREIQLAGFMPDQLTMIDRREDCVLCGGARRDDESA